MHTPNLISVLVLFSLLAACNMPAGQPPAIQPSGSAPVSSDVNAIGTAVELTSAARLTEMAGSGTPAFTSIPGLTPTPTQCSPLVTSTTNANVRSGPGTAYEIVGALPQGQTAIIAGRNDASTWWYISYPSGGSYAWIAGSVVTASCAPAIVQVVAAPPLPTAQPVVAGNSSSDDSGDEEDSSSDSGSGSEGGGSSAQPDLVANGMQTAPNPATQGEVVYVQVRVTNRGDAAAGPFSVQWWATWAKVGCDWSVTSLAPGASKALSCQYTYSGWNPAYDIKLVVDAGNTVTESNEGNNSKGGTMQVSILPIIELPEVPIIQFP
jgi:uncharacterized protein YraI